MPNEVKEKTSGYQTILSDGTVIWREAESNLTGRIDAKDLYDYWRDPCNYSEKNKFNREEDYFKCSEKSEKLVELFKRHIPIDSKIIELGCNVGRNLHFLYEAGYHNLSGIDINPKALQLGKERYKELADCNLICNEIGLELSDYPPKSYDVVFSMATLEHIHPHEAGSVFAEMGWIAKSFVVTAEDEKAIFWRAFSYDYKKTFEYIGFKEIETFNLYWVNNIDKSGDCTLTYRVFKK